MTKTVEEKERDRRPVRRGLRRRDAAHRRPVHRAPPPSSATTSRPSRTSRPRSAPRPAPSTGSRRSRSSSPPPTSPRPGDHADVLVAMNPAALKADLDKVERGRHRDPQRGRLHPAQHREGRATRPTRGRRHARRATRCSRCPMTSITVRATEDLGIGKKEAERAKNMFALGLVSWMFGRPDRDHARTGSSASSAASRRSSTRTSRPSRPATTSARRPSCSPSPTR